MADRSRVHGGIDPLELERFGVDPASVLDLSVNVNPFGPHPAVAAAIRAASLADYPDRGSTRARAALAGSLDCDPERIALGHGSVELLWALIATFARGAADRPLLIVGPTFGEPEAAARAAGLRCESVRMCEDEAFAVDSARIEAAIDAHRPCAVYLCQPNNPTGRALGSCELQALIDRRRDTTFLLDQAFLSLSSEHAQLGLGLERAAHVVVIRSLTKDHALAGLRVGYALGSPEWIARLEAARPPWMASALAQAAVVAAVQHPEHVVRARNYLLDARQQLTAALEPLGLRVIPSVTHYCLVRVSAADRVRERLLLRKGVLVRSCSSFGLPQYLRVAAGDATARARLVAGLMEHAT